MRMLRRVLAIAIFVALFAAVWRFVAGNASPVDVDLLFVRIPLPLWAALLGAFGLGALSAGASLLYELAKRSFAARRYQKQMAGLESEIHQLRNLPLAAPDVREGPAPPRATPVSGAVRQRS